MVSVLKGFCWWFISKLVKLSTLSIFTNSAKIIFHQDDAFAHKSVLTMTIFSELKYELLDHPPYSPDSLLFLHLKKFWETHFLDASENEYFADLPENYYRDGVLKLEDY